MSDQTLSIKQIHSTVSLKHMTDAVNTIQQAWLNKYPRCCPICLEKLDGSTGSVNTSCKHNFCLTCYLKLDDPRCPLCRNNIPISGHVPNNDYNNDDGDFAEFIRNPVRYIGDIIFETLRDPRIVIYRDESPNISIPQSYYVMSGLGYTMIGILLLIAFFSPYSSIYMLFLLVMINPPIINPINNNPSPVTNPTNTIFPRQHYPQTNIYPDTTDHNMYRGVHHVNTGHGHTMEYGNAMRLLNQQELLAYNQRYL